MKDKTIIEVDGDIARFWGIRWRDLGAYGKRKFENMLFLDRADKKELLVFSYK